jgi:energy-coupling factor transporter ATP-binding protein EcfA2
MTIQPVMEIKEYGYYYPGAEAPALEGISLAVGPGECVCLSGPSGSGKTTLLLAVKGLLKGGLASGSIQMAGPGSGSSPGLVFQNAETQILCTTVEDEAAFGPENQGRASDDIKRCVQESLEIVGLSGFETRNVEHLSAGEKHRLAVASVLSMSPKSLLLDEPTAQLDPSGKDRLVRILERLRDKGHTLLIADHDLAPFCGLADRFILMEQGRIRETLNEMPHILPVSPPVQGPHDRTATQRAESVLIHVKDLHLAGANGHPLFFGIDLELRRGALVHILGENGAGKSTLLRCMAGLAQADAGTIDVLGIKRLRPEALLGKVGFMFQNPERQLFEETVYAEVGFSLKRLGLPPRVVHERILEALAFCEADYLGARSPLTLSFGEQHRVAMASAIAPRPDVLLLDEPFAGLDFRQRGRILGILSRLRRERHTTVLIASHEYLPDGRWADQTLMLKDGKIDPL